MEIQSNTSEMFISADAVTTSAVLKACVFVLSGSFCENDGLQPSGHHP